ncbi:MAG: hypothetical protein KAS94_13915 [Desulfobulbaceae bacterium]|nr:hypothetical protein [Desulfobulbaceae bacterium]
MKTLKIFHVVLFLAILLPGCLPPFLSQKTSNTNTNIDFAPHKLDRSDFASTIKELTKITKSTTTSNLEKAEAHRRLAILYLIPRNPERDFQRATNQLGKFLEMTPNKFDDHATASWATALKSGEEYLGLKTKVAILDKTNSQLEAKVVALNKKNSQLTKEKKSLAVSNAELMKIIENLKKLDLSLEEKRRNFR